MGNSFVVNQKDLLATLFFMQPICTKRTTFASTSSILFLVSHKELILKATDLEISLQYNCNLVSSTIDQAQFLVSGKKIFDIVKEMEGDIECIFDDAQITLKSKHNINVSLNLKSAEEFPPLPERIENLMQMDTQFLSDVLGKVSFLIPQNNATPSLNGLFFEISPKEFKLTTTDGHCLAQVATDKYVLDQEKKWLLPRRAIFELKKILENCGAVSIFLGTSDNQLVFSGEHFNFFTKLLADEFPKYESILQRDAFIPATMNKTEFVKTLRRSSCMLSGQFLATNFTFTKDALKVSMKNNEVGNLEETLPLNNYDYEKLEMRFYSPYLLQGLQAFDDEQVTCYLKGNSRPIIFTSKSEQCDITYLVMPVSNNNP